MSTTNNTSAAANASANPTTITAPAGTPFVDLERDFDATPEQLHRATSDPDLVAQWLGPSRYAMRVDEYDVRPGGRYRYVHIDGDSGDEYGFRGVFHTVEPGVLVIQTFEFEGAPGQVSIETASYTDLGNGKTRYHAHSVYPSVEARDMTLSFGMADGARESLERLQQVVSSLS